MAKSKYDSLVAPRLDEIKDWCRNGATDLEVYTRQGAGTPQTKKIKGALKCGT